MKDSLKTIKEIGNELLGKLQIKGKIEVSKNEEIYEVTIDTEETGLLIGYHGNTLNSLQLILGLLVYKKLQKWERLVVNVGDYRQKREEALNSLATQYAQQTVTGGEPVVLPYLSPSERRIVHLALQDHLQVISESQGEGKDRRIVIKLKK